MWKTALFVMLAAASITPISAAQAGDQTDFKVCKSTYALCTTAACTPVAGTKDTVSCVCEVKTGYSAGLEDCAAEKDTGAGTEIKSRYFPVKSYAICTNDRPWAWCLDKPAVRLALEAEFVRRDTWQGKCWKAPAARSYERI